MDNIQVEVRGSKLILEVDLEHTLPGTTKGGNYMVATSDSWARLPELPGWSFNMALVRKPEAVIPSQGKLDAGVPGLERPKLVGRG